MANCQYNCQLANYAAVRCVASRGNALVQERTRDTFYKSMTTHAALPKPLLHTTWSMGACDPPGGLVSSL